jgi:long-chain acyl-CoA synthetase
VRQNIGYVGAIREVLEPADDIIGSVFEGRSRKSHEILDKAARVASGLRAAGLVDGDRVAVLSGNSDDYLILYLAIPWAGGVIVPLNGRWSPAENRFAIDDCAPRILFVSDDAAEINVAMIDGLDAGIVRVSLGRSRAGWLTMPDLLDHEPAEDAGRSGDDLLGIFYTGGTTGRPKGVMLSHAGFVGNCIAMRDFGLAPAGCRMLVVAPLFHLAAVAVMTMAMLAAGTAVIAPGFGGAATLELIEAESITDALLVPTMIQMMMDVPGFEAAKLSSLKTVIYGSSPMPEATIDRIMAAAPHINFYQGYGMTEASCTVSLLKPEFHRGAHREAGRHRGAGHPLARTDIIIVDEHGTPLPIGEVGEILVRGQGVMLGYWHLPEQTAEALRDGWVYTGDGGRLDDHGILYVVDRLKDMIVSGGENVYSAEVESAIASHPDVAQCAVIGVPDPRWGERVHAVVVPRSGVAPSVDEITRHCRTLIAGYKCPRTVEFRSALPISSAGKILKAALRAPFWEGQTRNVA